MHCKSDFSLFWYTKNLSIMKTTMKAGVAAKTVLVILFALFGYSIKSQSQINCSFQVTNNSGCTVFIQFEWHHHNGTTCYCPQVPNCGPWTTQCNPGVTTLFNDAVCCPGAVDVSFYVVDASGTLLSTLLNMGCANAPNSTTYSPTCGAGNVSIHPGGILVD